ncbi:MAG TPA: efflux RND transporter periplasmic adaptor subunit [Acidobacteriota bacterium]|nr:efflux RND transporter periplasmic adaptor subunit [Acidobacteriota bacterium]
MRLRKRTKRFLIGGGVLVVVAVVAIVSLSGSDKSQTVVQADLVTRDDISEIVTASGRIQPQTKVDIVAEVSAQIVELYVNDGERVSRGQPLLLLDTVQLKSDVAQARYSLDEITARTEAALAQFEKDRLEYVRQSSLFKQSLTSETAFNNATYAHENARANHEAMKAQMKTAQARLDKALDNLTKTHIMAPMNGVVTYLSAEVGEIAQGQTSYTQGKTLMTISDLSVFEVEVDVDETEIAKLTIGDSAGIRADAFRDTTFSGSVVEIGNSALVQGQGTENYSTSFRVKVRFDEAHALIRPGMSATVDMTTAMAKDAILIPYASVVTREFDADSAKAKSETADSGGLTATANAAEGEPVEEEPADTTAKKPNGKAKKVKKTGIFLVKNGKAEFVEITTGIADERNIVALTDKVAAGDTVVSGSFRTLRELSDGEEVTIEQSSLQSIGENGG